MISAIAEKTLKFQLTAAGSKARARSNLLERALLNNPGDFLLSPAVSRAVPSAPAGLTSVFGMGTGVTLPTKSPENLLRALYFHHCSWPEVHEQSTKIKAQSSKIE